MNNCKIRFCGNVDCKNYNDNGITTHRLVSYYSKPICGNNEYPGYKKV